VVGTIPTHKRGLYLFPHTHTTKTKRTINIKNQNKGKKEN
jgi:hypothetical protein